MAPHLQQRLYEFDLFRVDVSRRLLLRQGEAIPLTPKAFDILLILVQNRDRVVEKDELMKLVWPDTAVEENNLTRNISSLRRALGERPEEHRYIVTIPGRGYRFAAELPAATVGTDVVFERHARARVLIEEQSDSDSAVQAIQPAQTEVVEQKSARSIAFQVSVAVVACTLLAAASLYIASRREAILRPPRVVPLTSLPDRAECSNLSPDGDRVAFTRQSDSPDSSGIYIKQIGSEDYLQITRNVSDWCPAWSPDGRYLAFSRYAKQEHSIYLISALGGAERKLHSGAPAAPLLDWSPDGSFIAFSAAPPGHRSSVVSLLSLETLQERSLTEPVVGSLDFGPAFSADGKQLAFVRNNGTNTKGDIFVAATNGTGVRRLTFDNAWIGPPSWTRDGKFILFSSARNGLPTIWKIPAMGGSPIPVLGAGPKALRPTLSRSGDRLAFEQRMGTSSLWDLNLSAPGNNLFRRKVIASPGNNRMAQPSPDGKRLVFISYRSGSEEIFVCNADGTNLLQLTHLGNGAAPGVPRWSPDGQEIALDLVFEGHSAIFVMRANGGLLHRLTPEHWDNINASWSHDGKWIFFASNRTGQWQIWKIARQGGEPIQLTRQGGFAAFESADSKSIYYAKTASEPDIWRMQLDSGQEDPVAPSVHVNQWTGWALSDKGIFFVRENTAEHPVLRFLDVARTRITDIAPLEKQPFPLWISASSDGQHLLYEQLDTEISNVMSVESFR
jgi:Tol biopolymer transport system component/DNA-binding winged helix-turn-helix (wHTH) protein